MHSSLLNSSGVVGFLAILTPVSWSYFSFAAILVIGLCAILLRGHSNKGQALDKLLVLAPVFYAAPLAAFGTEHFTVDITPLVPAWIPWHKFWVYLVGACFIAAGLSLVTKIQARLSASLLAATFFLFVVLMDVPAWLQDMGNRFSLTLALRELSFSGGPLALAAASLVGQERKQRILATIARYFVAIPVLFFSFEQFMHGYQVPAVPLNRLTPQYVYGHAIWTYLVAVVYLVAGVPLIVGRKARASATWVGLAVLWVEIVVYLPIAVVQRASLEGFNYMGDTLMFCGTVLLLAAAMPPEAVGRKSLADQWQNETGATEHVDANSL